MPARARAPQSAQGPTDSSTATPGPLSGPGNAAVQEEMRQPRGDISGDPGVLDDTVHAPLTRDDLSGMPTHSDPAMMSTSMKVTIVAGFNNPVTMQGEARPAEEDLFVEDEAGSEVTEQIGSVASPQSADDVNLGSLYIAGAPSASDIQQGSIGDCYFLAATAAIASGDPGQISGMISPGAGSATITFHYYDESDGSYKPEPVTVDHELLHDAPDENGASGRLYGAGVLVAEQPDHTEWNAELDGGALGVVRWGFYDVALWPALLEKAYERFAQDHGQYGGAPDPQSLGANSQTDENGDPEAGAAIIEGGWECLCYPMFYGERAQPGREEDTAWTAGENPVVANAQAIRTLLMLQGRGLEEGQQAFLTCSTSEGTAVTRLREQIGLVMAEGAEAAAQSFAGGILSWGPDLVEAWMDGTIDLFGDLRGIQTYIDGPWTEEESEEHKEALAALCEAATLPDHHPLLHEEDAPKKYVDLLDLLLQVRNIGTDTSNGQRSVYASHAYAVLGVTFRSGDGAVLELDPAQIPGNLEEVSAERSSLTLRNPHHTNEPDTHGEGPVDGTDDGEFTYSLDQFFRLFSAIDSAVVDA